MTAPRVPRSASPIAPPALPDATPATVRAWLSASGASLDAPALVARRGYYRDTMGQVGANDRNLYDDALWLVSPTAFVAFNANTDPSRSVREAPLGLACLEPGVWTYKVGKHRNQYRALVQADAVVVHRHGTEAWPVGQDPKRPDWGHHLGGGKWRGWFGINVHRGGVRTTSSLGCQTIPAEQWPAFMPHVDAELRRYARATLPLVLVAREDAPPR